MVAAALALMFLSQHVASQLTKAAVSKLLPSIHSVHNEQPADQTRKTETCEHMHAGGSHISSSASQRFKAHNPAASPGMQ